ncbi:serine O-acetyltransferase [Sinobacterium caligoides]|uniref:Serine acetyltransferase n=1 Tax=Sinobacterium caligoides TaxID=933926 RepID=A0A3N2E1Y7_9GAMM|nr:serine O-acetyltransferase [Sinobacterium caligoides]ROS06121.1 serine O-acetyltransferase [Sinobacterium caligoides]
MNSNEVWQHIIDEVRGHRSSEPLLASFYHAAVLNHSGLDQALAYQLAIRLDSETVPAMLIRDVCNEAFAADKDIMQAVLADLSSYPERDAACKEYSMPLLYFKGFQAVQAYRVSHWLWQQGRVPLALYFQNCIATVFDVDIHPAATIGFGLMLDHATGLVIGETAVVGNNVSILHEVTLGGSGCSQGARHPVVGDGVLISAGAKVLGGVTIGEGAKIAAGSVVLSSVAEHTTVAGVPAKVVGIPRTAQPALSMNHDIS